MRQFTTITDKILDRALYLIGMKGNYDVPIREITKAAGVNVNAINYYFGNKEALIEYVDRFFIDNYIAAYSILYSDEDAEYKLAFWANEIMEYVIQYPGTTTLLQNARNMVKPSIMKDFLEKNARMYDEKVMEVVGDVFNVTGEQAKMLRTLLYAAILHPASKGTGVSYDTSFVNDRESRLLYINFVISTLKKGMIK